MRLNAELVIPVSAVRGGGKAAGGESALARRVAQARRSGVSVLAPRGRGARGDTTRLPTGLRLVVKAP